MKINKEVIAPAKKAYFSSLKKMPETVTNGFLMWAKEEGKDPTKDTEENREMMYKLACYARATWMF